MLTSGGRFMMPPGVIILPSAASIADVQNRTWIQFYTHILIFSIPVLAAMTFEFHRNRYQSPRGPSDAAVMVRMPRSLSLDLTALTLAYEEPKYSVLLRIIEEYVDSHREDVEKGRWRMSHYRSEGWDEGPGNR